jgi:hypothetical protein
MLLQDETCSATEYLNSATHVHQSLIFMFSPILCNYLNDRKKLMFWCGRNLAWLREVCEADLAAGNPVVKEHYPLVYTRILLDCRANLDILEEAFQYKVNTLRNDRKLARKARLMDARAIKEGRGMAYKERQKKNAAKKQSIHDNGLHTTDGIVWVSDGLFLRD